MSVTRFGIAYNGYEDAQSVRSFAQSVEDTFDSIWVNENVHSEIPHLDPLVTLGTIAGATSKLELGTAAILLPLMNPVWLARAALTLQRLSTGRLILGVANGGGAPEGFAAYGVPLSERAARTEEYITVMRALWRGAPVNHEGRYVRLEGFEIGGGDPPPPVWLGGAHPKVAERAGRLADGFLPIKVSAEVCRGLYETIGRSAEAAGRAADSIRRAVYVYVLIGYPGAAVDTAKQVLFERYARRIELQPGVDSALGEPDSCYELLHSYLDVGAEHLVLDILCPPEAVNDQLAALKPLVDRLAGR